MNAREILDGYRTNGAAIVFNDAMWPTVYEALSLLAAAEANDGTTPETDKWAGEAVFTETGCAADVVNADFARALERRCSGLAAEVGRLREALKTICEEVTMPIRNAVGDVEDCAEEPAWSRDDMSAIARRALDAARAKP
jgi:hypothetical protein